MDKSRIKIAFISTYPPRECGIATYTIATARVLDKFYVSKRTGVIAISDCDYSYSDRAVFEIEQDNRQSYIAAAEFLNASDFEVVNVQHEYGIFGGNHGEYIVDFLKALKKPVVTTLHTVLPVHPPKRRRVTQEIIKRSDALIVMTNHAKRQLNEVFKVDNGKINVVHHGVPNVRPDQYQAAKRKHKLTDYFVTSTFGLISPDKGIEYILDAVAQVVPRVPNLMYLVMGETHPVLKRQKGEEYRESLLQRVEDLGIAKNVRFVDRYLGYGELVEYLQATDVYLAHPTNPYQASSGTLAYAVGVGTATISTETSFAKEVLANGRGYLIDFFDSTGMANRLLRLAKSPSLLAQKRMKTYLYGRRMTWPVVGLEYLKVYEKLAYGKQLFKSRKEDKVIREKTEFIPS